MPTQRWYAGRSPGGWTVPDALLAVGFAVLLVTEIVPNPDMTPHVPLVAGSLAITLPLAWRRAFPAAVAVMVCSAHLVVSVVSSGPFPPQTAILPVLVALYTAASSTRGRVAVVTGLVTALLSGFAWILSEDGHADDFWPWMLWAGAWATGTLVRRRGDAAAHHADRAALLEVEARTTAAESAQAERDRIAREMHDVVAHSVSVMVVQAGAERLRLGSDAGPTGEALAAIEASGRTALAELRGMLGVLRDGSDESLAPLPGLAALPSLLDRVREAGLPVEVTCRPADLLDDARVRGSSAGLAAYRITQEALTNVMRHQGLVPTRIELSVVGDCLSVAVTSMSPAPASQNQSSGGRGLLGMRERASAIGGTFEAGERDGEYFVRAALPLRAGSLP